MWYRGFVFHFTTLQKYLKIFQNKNDGIFFVWMSGGLKT